MFGSAIDIARSVKLVKLDKGTLVYRFERVGREGGSKHFFADRYTVAGGPRSVGFENSAGYQLKAYQLLDDMEVLDTAIKGTHGNSRQFIFDGNSSVIKEVPLPEGLR